MSDRIELPKMVIAVRKDLNMRKGKLAAQVAHASMQFLINRSEDREDEYLHVKLSEIETEWLFGGFFTKVVVGVDSEKELFELSKKAKADHPELQVWSVTDLGFTEFGGVPTLTCTAFGPDQPDVIDRITGHLRLL